MADVPEIQDIFAVRGDTFRRTMDLAFATGDLTGVEKLWFTVKRAKGDADEDAVIQITTGAGITVVDGTSATFEVDADTMATLTGQTRWPYDTQALLASGDIVTCARGSLIVTDQITLATA